MTGHDALRHLEPAREQAARLLVVLALPLLLVAGTAVPEPGAGMAGLLVALVVALALGSWDTRSGLLQVRSAGVAGRRTPRLSSRIPDPVRHPVRPRAPGSA